jgi:murein DD-endopeptidase MepM/ murein hydrolase activator NlpD
VRVRTGVLVALAVLAIDVPQAAASESDLLRAQRRANAAAADLARAQTRLSRIQSQLVELEARKADAERRIDALGHAVRDLAVSRFLEGGQPAGGLVFDPTDALAQRRAEVLTGIVTATSADVVDAYRALSEDLTLAAARLGSTRRAAAGALAGYQRRARAARASLARLEQFERERRARDRVRSRSGGRRRSVVVGSGPWICPVQGPRAFSDDYGDPRGGGRRRHQGNDILAPRGTPVVAPVSGTARQHNSGIGGLSFYLHGSDGTTYFGTHLDAYAASGSVSAGTVLGYVGNSGNARGGPTHLHFEIHPGGGGPVNPYPTLRAYC